jgi:membrane protein DedA with SNARE-associated domain/uncharacterized RDD family membrane protein YckC
LPFAPGDLLLVLGGLAIATGSVNALILGVCVTLAIISGAMLGREVFALVGRAALERAASVLRFKPALDRVSRMVQRGGWRAVFVARLIPGLRIQTTQVAGVTGMPRLEFLVGLVPAVIIYVAFFVTVGRLAGQPAVHAFHRAEHRLFVLAAFAVLAAAFVLSVRWLAERGHLNVLEPIVLGVRRELADEFEARLSHDLGPEATWHVYPVVRRVWAGTVDLLLVIAITIYGLTAAMGLETTEVVLDPAGLLVLAGVALLYRIPLEAIWGQTLGKRIMGISVYGPDDAPPGWERAVLRNLVGILPPVWLIDVFLLWRSPCRQRLGDRLCDATVRRVAR